MAECQASCLSVKTWCDQNGFKEQSYYYYLRKIREQEIDNLPVSIPKETTDPVVFKKLEIQSSVTNTQAAVIVHLPSA
ncbi:IS66 family insertion sequence element accessory protein TnpA [Lacrimispora sphenoides]|uniref:IS66 family insertion sequence element accessory protein TnpA n=1 Tax=Lacrimispora sphenoides TaxID=29370 RepID=UPI0038CC07AB